VGSSHSEIDAFVMLYLLNIFDIFTFYHAVSGKLKKVP